jgi:hypothetical protein
MVSTERKQLRKEAVEFVLQNHENLLEKVHLTDFKKNAYLFCQKGTGNGVKIKEIRSTLIQRIVEHRRLRGIKVWKRQPKAHRNEKNKSGKLDAAKEILDMYPDLKTADLKDFKKRPVAYVKYLRVGDFELTSLVKTIIGLIQQTRGPSSKKIYSNYLKKEIWTDVIRPRILKRDGSCQICGSKNRLQVHHRSYKKEVLQGKDDSQLITLCGRHHVEIEFEEYYGKKDARNKKRHRSKVDKKLTELLKSKFLTVGTIDQND